MRLEKIGFANYRSIGNTYAYIDLTKRINLLIGPNNAGKSNIISALELIKNTIKPITEELKLNPEDIHKVNTDNFVVCFVVMINSNRLYVPINYKNGRIYENEDYIIEAISQDMPRIPQMELYESVFNILQMELPKIIKIPPIREIKHGDGSKYTPDGKGIIEILADWKSPEKNEDYKREKFEKIQSFLRVLLNDGRIEIDVPTKQPEILIKAGYQRLPLSHFGTGVHELIILAITLLSYKNTLICLEEPEIHLHPLLQKKLLNFLLEKTTNNYLITTHSNSMLIFDDRVSITRVYKENDATIAKSVTETKEILPLLNDLGCCASDIIQANSVIWVEGPSDRTYINKWISLISKNELKEGIDYSIMFYGGALCAHISMSDISEEETNNLINLLSINRHSAIVCDSDKNESSSELKPNVSRLKDECAKNGKTFWVTDGRTIENYVPIEYFKEVLKSDVKTDSYNEFSEIHFDKYNNNKPKYSKEIAEKITKDDVEKNEGLLAHIKDMIKMIENANPVSKELEK